MGLGADIPRIDAGGYRPLGPIVRARELAQWAEAAVFLDQAKARAEEIIEAAEEEAALLREQSRERGYQDGMEKMLAQLETNAKEVEGTVAQLSRSLPDLVTGCVEKIIGRIGAEELTCAVVAQAVAQLHNRGRMTLQVAPAMQESVQGWLQDHARANGFEAALFSVRPNPELKPGDLLVETAVGLLDATLETQIEKLRRVLAVQPDRGKRDETVRREQGHAA